MSEKIPTPARIRNLRTYVGVASTCLACLLAPTDAGAAAWVRSVEYVEVILGGGITSSSTNLNRGQNPANCVPFASEMVSATDDQYERSFTDVFFQTGPARVTAQRDEGVGTVTVGVFVVEFEPAYVKVQQGTFSILNGAGPGTPTMIAITPVTLTKAALVFYHRQSSFLTYSDIAALGYFSAANQLTFVRSAGNANINGHYFVFEALNSEFSVQAVSFSIADATSTNSATIAAVDLTKTFVIASHRTEAGNNDNDDSQLGVWLASPTTLTARRQWQSAPPPPNNTITDIRAFVVSLSDGVTVQRGTLSYATTDLQQTAPITAVNPGASMVWNGSEIGPGTIESQAEVNTAIDTGFQKLKLASATSVQGDRGESCVSACAGVGYFEVIDWATATAVTLTSFTAHGRDSAVELSWETASELNNLGFHLYRAASESGPYERVTASVIPGLGSSPSGARYRYVDSGLVNGTAYFYKLEDIETTGKTELHGPVFAAPEAGVSTSGGAGLIYGDPSGVSFRVLSKDSRGLTLELITSGFTAEPQENGSVRFSIPGFVDEAEPGAPEMPVRRSWVQVDTGRRVRVASVRSDEVEEFSALRPVATGAPEVVASRRGTVRASRGRRAEGEAFRGAGWYPQRAARIVSVGYQGESKKALLELAPLRWDRSSGKLRLARKLTVRLAFTGRDEASDRRSHERSVSTRFLTRERGLYGVSFQQVFGGRRRGIPPSSLRLSRLGEVVAFHLEPDNAVFGPGSMLYFRSEGASVNSYGDRAVYELGLSGNGMRMPVTPAAPSGDLISIYWQRLEREENRYYQAGLLEAEDLWQWDLLFAPVTRSYPFSLSAVASSNEPARLGVWLSGVSDFPVVPDHHLRFFVNGTLVAESFLEGKTPLRLEATVPAGTLREGENQLAIENVGDTEAAYSMVMLDRFALSWPRLLVAESGKLEGSFRQSGLVEVKGLDNGTAVLDVTEQRPRWLTGVDSSGGTVRFGAEANRSYAVVSPEAVLKPEIEWPLSSRLKATGNQSDYLVIGPEVLLEAATPLLDLRRSEGLKSLAISIERVYSEFGFGEARPEAVRDFISYAYHHWQKPAPRYVLLMGDASYDFKDYLGTGVRNQVPPMIVKTSYLWTASDPTYAAVNGDDDLPDVAIGRLPAENAEGARAMVQKILAYESTGGVSRGPVVLVADNRDGAGNFEADVEKIASRVSTSRSVQKIYLSSLGTEATRAAIVGAFDQGAWSLSYVGHGGIHLWAHENIFNTAQVAGLQAQAQQPFVLTLDCLNGYFHFPYFNSLGEELLKAEGKGAVAAISPSGLSLDEPAHLLHQALLGELLSGRHERLGDAVSAAQAAYAESGAFPELLSIYHLFGDPALRIR